MIGSPAALPRLIASDLDGTFLSPDGSISALNHEAVRRAGDAGIQVVFATGRPPRWLDVLRSLPAGEGRVICSNGAGVYDATTDELLTTHPIPLPNLHATIERIRRVIPGASFAVEQGFEIGFEDSFIKDMRGAPHKVATGPAEELIEAGPVLKLLVQHPTLHVDDLWATAVSLLSDQVTVTHSSFGALAMLEISAAGVTKATTLAEYCRGLGIAPAEVAAFGDMPNDAAMLTWAGRAHVMAEAHVSLDAIGALRIGSNHDSGVGRTVLSWLEHGADVPR